MALADDLLEQAEHLASYDPRRPRQASLRRAVSTAYYALFHLLVSDAVGYWRLERQRAKLARAFEHRRMKGVAKEVSESRNTSADLKAITRVFVELQQWRYLADYDSSKIWTRLETRLIINQAMLASVQWTALRERQDAQDFLLSMLVHR